MNRCSEVIAGGPVPVETYIHRDGPEVVIRPF
jgi:hypothetical protein